MRGTAPTTLTLPPFRGATRRIVLINLVVFFALAVFSFAAPPAALNRVEYALALSPDRVAHGWIWQPITYSFLNIGILGTAFGLLTLWFTGSMLEDARGHRWFTELYYICAVGGGLLAALLGMLPLFGPHVRLFTLMPFELTFGVFAPLFGVLVAFGILFADVEIMLFFVLRMRVKYLVAIYILVDIARLILGKQALTATVELSCGLCAFLYVRYAASRGLGFNVAERYFALRNDYYRYKRRSAAKKFEVHMRKHGRTDIHFDNEGRYISPEDERRKPNDRKWMN
jgi:membrane associated rhomboid family serine protease